MAAPCVCLTEEGTEDGGESPLEESTQSSTRASGSPTCSGGMEGIFQSSERTQSDRLWDNSNEAIDSFVEDMRVLP